MSNSNNKNYVVHEGRVRERRTSESWRENHREDDRPNRDDSVRKDFDCGNYSPDRFQDRKFLPKRRRDSHRDVQPYRKYNSNIGSGRESRVSSTFHPPRTVVGRTIWSPKSLASMVWGVVGNSYNPDVETQPPLMTFTFFLETQESSITNEEATKRYEEYKIEFKKRQLHKFFVAHRNEEWFQLKYHPERLAERRKKQLAGLNHPNKDQTPNQCGILHVRDAPPNHKMSYEDMGYCKMDPVLAPVALVSPEDYETLGVQDVEAEVEKFTKAQTRESLQYKWECMLCGKKLNGPDFVRIHILNSHAEKVAKVKFEVEYFNNYLKDPLRPQLPEHPKIETPPRDSSNSSRYKF